MEFNRGTVVHHKIMGIGIVLNMVNENGEQKIEVRMKNGQIEKYYPEELETDQVVKAREQDAIDAVLKHNEEMGKRWGI